MDELLQLTFLGVGNAGALDLGNSSAVLETADGLPLLLIDCGPSVLSAFAGRYGSLPKAIFITHLHFDHVGGLENLFFRLASRAEQASLVRLFVPVPIVDRLHQRLADDACQLAEGGVTVNLSVAPAVSSVAFSMIAGSSDSMAMAGCR